MHNPKRELRDFRRLKEVLTIVTKEGFGYILDTVNLSKHVPLTTKIMNQKRETRPERLRETLEKLGTTYIKFGQILAERPDLLSRRYTEELQKLQDSVEPFSGEKAREITEEEIGLENFTNFNEEPLATASIAQIHRATLETGEDVVVKIRRPGIKEEVEKDLDILNYIANEGEKHLPKLKDMEAVKFIEKFSDWTRKELDMINECSNAQIFRDNMEEQEKVYVPEVYPELTTEKVLVMEYVEGIKCTEEEKIKDLDINEKEIAEEMIKANLKQTMEDGFFHADPHPSNFLISEEGKIIYLDFGMMGNVSKKKSRTLGLMLLYMIREDSDGIMDCLEEIGTRSDSYSREQAQSHVEEKILKIKNTSLKQNSLTKQLFDLFVELSEEGLHMPSNMALLGKNLVTMEGIGLTIYPEFQINQHYEKIAMNELRETNSKKEMMKDLSIDLIKNRDLITNLPTKLNKKLDQQEKPEINIDMDQPSQTIFPAVVILSSTAMILGSVYSRYLLYVGLLTLGYGFYIYGE